ncbi:hypothetical protein M8C21_020423 [Ambrosia artemisiifolia]|uniref:Uncharacterized protein n=1 Tax=Ambrosia artemisiifolia TaxID=4212 RepID=A0AAD5BS20_AMBAR|nr:hypothetical protein M8C21_020423 [Ambrosia artemisiifolia]
MKPKILEHQTFASLLVSRSKWNNKTLGKNGLDVDALHISHIQLNQAQSRDAGFIALMEESIVDSSFVIPCLEEVVITVRSPLNVEQKMSTLEALVKFGMVRS